MKRYTAFTLTEVVITVAIILAIAAVTAAVLVAIQRKVKDTVCASHMASLHQALQLYRLQYDGAESITGDVGRLGLPPYWCDSNAPDIKPMFGSLEEWTCPAPKPWRGEYMPHYIYIPFPRDAAGSSQDFSAITSEYKDRTPIILDYNHNDWTKVNLYRSHSPKYILYLDLIGRLHRKIVRAAFHSSDDMSFFEISRGD